MTRIRSMEDLAQARNEALEKQRSRKPVQIRIATGSCGLAAGAGDTLEAFQRLLAAESLPDGENGAEIVQTGCIGLCALEPVVDVRLPGQPAALYGQVTPEVARKIVQQHLHGGLVVSEHLIENV